MKKIRIPMLLVSVTLAAGTRICILIPALGTGLLDLQPTPKCPMRFMVHLVLLRIRLPQEAMTQTALILLL
jgi:hypothetical protein